MLPWTYKQWEVCSVFRAPLLPAPSCMFLYICLWRVCTWLLKGQQKICVTMSWGLFPIIELVADFPLLNPSSLVSHLLTKNLCKWCHRNAGFDLNVLMVPLWVLPPLVPLCQGLLVLPVLVWTCSFVLLSYRLKKSWLDLTWIYIFLLLSNRSPKYRNFVEFDRINFLNKCYLFIS